MKQMVVNPGKNVTIEDEHKRENKKGSPSISTK